MAIYTLGPWPSRTVVQDDGRPYRPNTHPSCHRCNNKRAADTSRLSQPSRVSLHMRRTDGISTAAAVLTSTADHGQ